MCGIAGCLGSNVKEQYAITMGKTLTNRGPDDFGSWADRNNGIAFSHTRLAILDLQEGKQPMVSHTGRYIMAYNGEIYNHLELRGSWRKKGTRHTGEVIRYGNSLSCFEFWGISATIRKKQWACLQLLCGISNIKDCI